MVRFRRASFVLVLLACADSRPRNALPPAIDSASLRVPARVGELFVALADSQAELSGLAYWAPVEGDRRILASSPAENAIQLREAADGSLISEYRRAGSGAGAVREPVGLATLDSIAFIVERGNHRVQAFRLPGFETIGVFGAEELIAPEWIALLRQGASIDAYVSDREAAASGPDTAIATRIRLFRIDVGGNRIAAGLMRSFGHDAGLGHVTSIAIDSARDRVLVADRVAGVIVFSLAGDRLGLTIPVIAFSGGPTALALRPCGREAGHWIVTDTAQSFHVFDRITLAPVTRFWGRTLAPTAGVQVIDAARPSGAKVIAVHARRGIGALEWSVITDSIPSLRRCASEGGG
jgi:3-phytase